MCFCLQLFSTHSIDGTQESSNPNRDQKPAQSELLLVVTSALTAGIQLMPNSHRQHISEEICIKFVCNFIIAKQDVIFLSEEDQSFFGNLFV